MVGVNAVLTQLINGLAYGGILVLLAIGLSLVFGLMGIVNFAHGAFYTIGAYAAALALGIGGEGALSYLLTFVAVAVVVGAAGLLAERTVIRPLYDREVLYSLILTFGLFLAVEGAIDLLWGQNVSYSTPPMLAFRVSLGVVNYPFYRLFVILVAGALSLLLWLFLTRTDIGAIVRAATENRDMVKVLGIDIDRVYTFVFALGAALAGIAGLMHAPLVSLYPEMGGTILIESFVVVVIGGLNQFRGAVVAGILVGEVRALTFLVSPGATDVVVFVLMAVVLLVRPRGLLGTVGGVE